MPFSYWATMRAERASAMSAIRTTTIQKREAMTARGLSMSGPHAKGDSVHALDFDDAARFERTGGIGRGNGAPHLVLDPHHAGLVARHALSDQGFGADHRVHVARHVAREHARTHPAAADEHVKDGESRRREKSGERIAHPQADPSAEHERRSDEHQIEAREPAERKLDQDEYGSNDHQYPAPAHADSFQPEYRGRRPI